MALVYPVNRTDYLGQIHFSSLEETTTGGQPTAAASSSAAAKKSKNSGFSVSDILAFSGADDAVNSLTGDSGPRPSGEKAILHLPQAITIADKADYGTANLGMLGGAIEAGMNAPTGSTPSITSFLDSMKGGAGKDLSKIAVAKTVGAFSEEAGNAVRSTARVTTNPNVRALFNSIPLRSFTFSFKMIPHSQEEAQNIKEIITFFRKELYPEEIPAEIGDGITFSAGYKFPNRFGIKMYYGEEPFITEVGTRIKPAYLTDLQTIYNSSSMGMHYDGNFSEVDLSLTFLESKALSRTDVIEEGFAEGILDENGNML